MIVQFAVLQGKRHEGTNGRGEPRKHEQINIKSNKHQINKSPNQQYKIKVYLCKIIQKKYKNNETYCK